MAALAFSSHLLKTFTPTQYSALLPPISISFSRSHWKVSIGPKSRVAISAAINVENSSKRSSSSEPRETIMLPGCEYNRWISAAINVENSSKDPAPTREQIIETYLNTLATVLGSMEEAKKNMYAFSTTIYTGFQCTVDEETAEKFKGLSEVLWVLPESYIDVKNKDYGGDKYINGEIIPCSYSTHQPKQRDNNSKYQTKRYQRGMGHLHREDQHKRQLPRTPPLDEEIKGNYSTNFVFCKGICLFASFLR